MVVALAVFVRDQRVSQRIWHSLSRRLGGGKEDWYYYFTVSWIRVSRPPASVPRFIYINHKVKTGQKAGKHSIDGLILGEGGRKGGGERGG